MTGASAQSPAPSTGDLRDHEPIADAAVRALIEQYAIVGAVDGVSLREIGAYLYELRVAPQDRAAFGDRALVRLAFSVEALQEDPEAEMAVPGSAFVEQLVAAIRSRGTRRSFGLVPPTAPVGAEDARIPVPVVNAAASVPETRLARHVVGRLTARVTVRAGAALREHLVDSGLFDLTTGVALPPDVAAACEAATTSGRLVTLPPSETPATRPMGELVRLMLVDLEHRLAPEIERARLESERALAHELSRIDRYYITMLADSAGRGTEIPDGDARRAVESEHQRRRQEEIGRHEVRADVHPAQIAEWSVPMQRAEWTITTREGRAAALTAQRALVGAAAWTLACPTCGASPEAVHVCREGHAACSACATACSVCTSGFCHEHGLLACHVDGAPACAEHARTCRSCRRAHCSTHEGRCFDGDHPACASCLVPCAHCSKVVCDAHATTAHVDSLYGPRRLCADCVRHCEGGTGEVVGPDEVARCASCDRVVCARHQTTCAVDGHMHCSRHVRRTDRSRRLVCEHDRASCAYEPNAVFAVDEVGPCATCGTVACSTHTGECAEDGRRHCTTHLVPVKDRPGAQACGAHHSVCHIDRVTFSLAGTAECPVCGRRACAQHRGSCASCGRSVCTSDLETARGHLCRTCRQFVPLDEPDDLLLQAVLGALSDGARPKSWRAARDATHRVVELDLGWTRRAVVSVRHGAERAEVVMRHSLLGSKRQ